MSEMRLRPAEASDADMLLAWRNDPVTRAACISQEPVARADHVAWLERTLTNPKRRLLIIERAGVGLGTARFDYDEPTEFSITVAPEHRGKAYALRMMKLAMSAETDFIARVRQENRACQRLLRAAGMRLAEDGPLQLWIQLAERAT